jgi:hypothetical protein
MRKESWLVGGLALSMLVFTAGIAPAGERSVETSLELVSGAVRISLDGSAEMRPDGIFERNYRFTGTGGERLSVTYLLDESGAVPPFVSIAGPDGMMFEYYLPEQEIVAVDGAGLSIEEEVQLHTSMNDYLAMKGWRDSTGYATFFDFACSVMRNVMSAGPGEAGFAVKIQTFTDLVIVFGHRIVPQDLPSSMVDGAGSGEADLADFHVVIEAVPGASSPGERHTHESGGDHGCIGSPPPCSYNLTTICWSDAQVCTLNCCRSCCGYQSSIVGAGCGLACGCCGFAPNPLCCAACSACLGAGAVDYLLCIGNCAAQEYAFMFGHGGSSDSEWPEGGEH